MPRFYGCYLLTSLNEKYKDHAYIGFTRNPLRRIRQHNGEIKGGAKKTSLKRPWELVCVIFGFPSSCLALRFEWTWQNPYKSSKLKEFQEKGISGFGNIHKVKAKARILFEILNSSPWKRLPLHIRFFSDQRMELRQNCPQQPEHMSLVLTNTYEFAKEMKFTDALDAIGEKKSQSNSNTNSSTTEKNLGKNIKNKENIKSESESSEESSQESSENDNECELGKNQPFVLSQLSTQCFECSEPINPQNPYVECPFCASKVHLLCMARIFLSKSPQKLLPTKGNCPCCGNRLIWGDIVRVSQKGKPGFEPFVPKTNSHSSRSLTFSDSLPNLNPPQINHLDQNVNSNDLPQKKNKTRIKRQKNQKLDSKKERKKTHVKKSKNKEEENKNKNKNKEEENKNENKNKEEENKNENEENFQNLSLLERLNKYQKFED
ncbi:structure-specific endonuclease subunit slx1 [Anaeramoeba ignava]|uniref:Structure-specific endonuclease subunit SLX1 homolog n=1 Tax=Anaeramoeba ignava TaxID=1746090 RepID=A0A9Q0LJK8_ANAIG|nr:structure-specific endonuclease subunit slx1 [Anaeramoeba ignava]